MKSLSFAGIFLLVLCALAGSVWFYFPTQPIQTDLSEELRSFEVARLLVEEGYTEKAQPLILAYLDESDLLSTEGKKWLQLLIQATEKEKDPLQMAIIYDYAPNPFYEDENASLLAAEGLLQQEQPEDYATLRNHWRGKETAKDSWTLLDAHHLLTTNKPAAAKKALKAHSMQGASEVQRLLILSFLEAPKNPKMAWDFLDKALNLDPKNPEIHLLRAKLLESANKPELAHQEYEKALSHSPHHFLIQEQLGDFYLRQNHLPEALHIWQRLIPKLSSHALWTKAWFWNKVGSAPTYSWKDVKAPDSPYLGYLLSLSDGEFWDENSFFELTDSSSYLKNEPTTYWLKLLSALQENKLSIAEKLLKENTFKEDSFHPQLEKALSHLVAYQLREGVQEPSNSLPQEKTHFPKDQYLSSVSQIEKLQENRVEPIALRVLVDSKEAYPAAFLAAGWSHAALTLRGKTPLAEGFPNWYSLALVQAIATHESPLEALTFAEALKPFPELQLEKGFLAIEIGSHEEALSHFLSVVKEDSAVGELASFEASAYLMDKGNYQLASNVIEQQKRCCDSVKGKELLARAALLQGNETLANVHYLSISDQSQEAKSYLANRAFAENNYSLAKQLTKELISLNPDNDVLKENLKNIEIREKAAG